MPPFAFYVPDGAPIPDAAGQAAGRRALLPARDGAQRSSISAVVNWPGRDSRGACRAEGCIYSDQLRDQRISFEAGLARPGTRRAWKTSRPPGVSAHCTSREIADPCGLPCGPHDAAVHSTHSEMGHGLNVSPRVFTKQASGPEDSLDPHRGRGRGAGRGRTPRKTWSRIES